MRCCCNRGWSRSHRLATLPDCTAKATHHGGGPREESASCKMMQKCYSCTFLQNFACYHAIQLTRQRAHAMHEMPFDLKRVYSVQHEVG